MTDPTSSLSSTAPDPDNLPIDDNLEGPLAPPEGEDVEQIDTGVVTGGDAPQTALDERDDNPAEDEPDDDAAEVDNG